MGLHRNFPRGLTSTFWLLSCFRLLTMQCKSTFTRCLTLSLPQRKYPVLRQQSQTLRFVGSNAFFRSCFFSHCTKLRGLPLRSHCLAALPSKISAFNSHMQQNAYCRNLKRILEDLLPCYCYSVKINSRTIITQVTQPSSAGKGANMTKLQTHHCMAPKEWTWLLSSVSFIPANKLWLQELNQLIGIKLLVLYKFLFLVPSSRGDKCPCCTPGGRACDP